jgi:hypothetical protein
VDILKKTKKIRSMKMKILSLSAAAFSVALIFTACKKDNSTSTDYTSEVSTQSDDESRFSSESDAVANDANAAMATEAYFNARTSLNVICDATIVADTVSNPRTLTITYNGTNCLGNRTRTGVVVLSIPAGIRWKNAGAAITMDIQNLKITRLSDSKSITINGSAVMTNVSGGLLINLPYLQSIIHTVTSAGVTVTFDNNTQRSWQISRKRVFTYNNGVVITETGTHTDGTNTGIAEWGTNRFGNAFTSTILEPIVVRQDCSFRIVSGKIQYARPEITASATFGLDAAGNATSCPTGTYYLKATWTGPKGNSLSLILPY